MNWLRSYFRGAPPVRPPRPSAEKPIDPICRYGEYYGIKFLSNGSFGKVILARKHGDNKEYTLKVISEETMRLPDEINILQDLKGVPNVVQYVEHFNTESELVIVCEYCNGTELFDHLVQNGPMSESAARTIFIQLCTAMAIVHQKGIVHRDIKPENIIIHNDEIVIIDWGLAFYPERTDERRSCGSPNYASPEVITKDIQYKGPEVDVWSMGCVLYTMLTATMPFNDVYIPSLFAKIRNCDVYYPDIVPTAAQDLLEKIFVRDGRPTITEILTNTWITS